jgi:predicted permease
MNLFHPLSPVVPVFPLVGTGFAFAHWKKISLASVTEISVYLGTPSLVFTSLASRPLFAGDIVVLFSCLLLIFVGMGLLLGVYFFLFRFRSGGFALPKLFMNAGNMGLPLVLLAFGQAGM